MSLSSRFLAMSVADLAPFLANVASSSSSSSLSQAAFGRGCNTTTRFIITIGQPSIDKKYQLDTELSICVVAHRVRIVARGLEGRGLVQLVGLVLLRVLVLEQVEPVLLLSPALLPVAGHFSSTFCTTHWIMNTLSFL